MVERQLGHWEGLLVSRLKSIILSCFVLCCWGCDDHSGGPSESRPAAANLDQSFADMVLTDATSDMGPPDYGEAAYVEMTISPRKSLYTMDETTTVSAIVYDRIGQVLEGYPIRYDTRPVEAASVTADGVVSFLREGAGAVRGCATLELCGRVSFFVDNAVPLLEVVSPERGAFISGEPTISVQGRTDPQGVRVYLNDQEVDVDNEGTFAAQIPAEFGLNLVDVVADDGIRRPPTRSVREVVWAPELLPRSSPITNLPKAASLRIDQSALDGPPSMNDPSDNPLFAASLTELLEILFSRIEPMQFVSDRELLDSDIIQLRLLDLSPGVPTMDVLFIDDGVEVFFSLDQIAVELSGNIDYQGESLNLDGRVLVDSSSFVQVYLRSGQAGVFNVELGQFAVSIERISAQMEDETVQILMESVGNVAGDALRTFLKVYLDALVEERVPELLGVSLDSIFEPLQEVPIEVEEGGPLPPGIVTFTILDATPSVVPNEALYFDVSAAIEEPADIEPAFDTPGVPGFADSSEPVWPALSAVSLALRLSTINYLLDSLWRQGVLQIDLTDEIPDSLRILISDASLQARLQPLVVPSPVGAPDELIFQLGEVDLILNSPTRSEPDIYVASIRAGFYVDFSGGQIRLGLSPNSADIRFELRQAENGRPILPPSSLNGLVSDNLWPSIERNLGEVLSTDLEPVAIDSESIREAVPTFEQMLIRPIFSELPKSKNGWVVGGGGAEIEIQFRQ